MKKAETERKVATSRGRAVVLAPCSPGPGETEAGGILCLHLNPAWDECQDPASKQTAGDTLKLLSSEQKEK